MKRMFSSEENCSRMKKLTGIYDVFQKNEGEKKQRLGEIFSCGCQPRQRHCSRMTCFRSLDRVMQATESYMVFSLQVAVK